MKIIKKLLYKSLSLERYLKLHQKLYFILYKMGILKLSEAYKYHYYDKNLIHEGDVVIDIGSNLGYYTFLFSKWVGSSGEVHSVEPIPIYQKIQKAWGGAAYQYKLVSFCLGTRRKKGCYGI